MRKKYEKTKTRKAHAAFSSFFRRCANSEDLDRRIAGTISFFDLYLWTFDPRRDPYDFPFVLWPFQRTYIADVCAHLKDQKDLLTEKSRDMGATWLKLGVILFNFMYKKGFCAHIISKKESDLDNKSMGSIFPKIGYMIDRLPKAMQPKGWDANKHCLFLKIINPENGNTITGESANANAGRSARYSLCVLDEFAFNPHGYSIWRTLADTTNCRMPVSTPCGMGNKFAELRQSNAIDVQRLHWRLHPLKDDAWYVGECNRRTAEEIAQELDISYHASMQGVVYKEFDFTANVEEVTYDPDLPLYLASDFGIGDATSLLWIQTEGNTVKIIDAYEKSGKAIDFYVPIINGEVPKKTHDGKPWPYEYDVEAVSKIHAHRLWKKPIGYGDDDCMKREKTGSSVFNELRKYGILIRSRRVTMMDRINATKKIIKGGFKVAKNLGWIIECLENYHWPIDDSGAIVMSSKPVHDKYSHSMSALEFFACNHRPGTMAREGYGRGSCEGAEQVASSIFGY